MNFYACQFYGSTMHYTVGNIVIYIGYKHEWWV